MKLIIFFLSLITLSFAVNTSFWIEQSYEEFEQGTPKNTSISSMGLIRLSPTLNLISETKETFIWVIVSDSLGNLYLGTGNESKIYKISKDGKTSVFFKSDATEVFSLAIDKENNLYVGTSPDGKIYKITPTGKSSIFFETSQKYIWCLAINYDGILYAGTGPEGKIYKISKDGKGKIFYDSNQQHIISMIADLKNNILYAGSEPDGIIYKIDKNKIFVLYDASEEEIKCLAIDSNQTLYFGANTSKNNFLSLPQVLPQQQKSNTQQDILEYQCESPITVMLTDAGQPQNMPPNIPSSGKGFTIYKITDGTVNSIITKKDVYLSSMILKENDIIIGTDKEGLIYSVNKEKEITTLIKCEQPKVLTLYKNNNDIIIGTGEIGNVYKLTSSYAKEGNFISRVYDTKNISHWGKINWIDNVPKGTSLVLQTRTGNLEQPDDTWTEWSKEYTNGAQITSTPARFIQYKANFKNSKGSTSILKKVSIAYLTQNLAPEIISINIEEPSQLKETNPLPHRMPNLPLKKTEKRIEYKAVDTNNDVLEYNIYFKGIDESLWKLLKRNYKNTSYILDTQFFPDGIYQVKIEAKDSPGNLKSLSLSHSKISKTFIIDNSCPRITKFDVNKNKVILETEDDISFINKCQYSINAKKWQTVFPVDHIFDSKKEEFKFTINLKNSEEYILTIRIFDLAGNVYTTKKIIKLVDTF